MKHASPVLPNETTYDHPANNDAGRNPISLVLEHYSGTQVPRILENLRKTSLDWPDDLSGNNLLLALKIIEERFEIHQEPEKKGKPTIQIGAEQPNPVDTVQAFVVDISQSEIEVLRNERGPLSEALIHRIERIMPVFKDLYTPCFKGGSATLRDEWIEGFNLDLHPENEVEIWEWVAKSLLTFSRSEVFTFKQFKEAYRLLESASMKSRTDTMKAANLQILTADQVEYLLSGC